MTEFFILNKLPFSVLNVHQRGPKMSDRRNGIFLARCLHAILNKTIFFFSAFLEACVTLRKCNYKVEKGKELAI